MFIAALLAALLVMGFIVGILGFVFLVSQWVQSRTSTWWGLIIILVASVIYATLWFFGLGEALERWINFFQN